MNHIATEKQRQIKCRIVLFDGSIVKLALGESDESDVNGARVIVDRPAWLDELAWKVLLHNILNSGGHRFTTEAIADSSGVLRSIRIHDHLCNVRTPAERT